MSVHVEYHLMKSVAEKETRKAGHWINRDAQPGVNAADNPGRMMRRPAGRSLMKIPIVGRCPRVDVPNARRVLGVATRPEPWPVLSDPRGRAKTALVAYGRNILRRGGASQPQNVRKEPRQRIGVSARHWVYYGR